jgi:D-alanyl-D-alanine carboxypeptidase
MRYPLLAVALGAATLVPLAPAADAPADEKKGLEAVVTEAWKKTKLPGAVVGVYRAGKPPLVVAVGHADADKKAPMTPDCHFRIASLSKVFVGTAVLTLIDEGKVSADDTIDKFVKGVPNGDKVTLRHLATHRAGVFNLIESKTMKEKFAAAPQKWWPEDELLGIALNAPAYFEPGAKHHYSNAHTVLLAKVLEKATGKRWQDEVAARVLKPLGLKRTSVATDNKLPVPFARGYALGGEKTPFFVRGDIRHDVTDTSPSWWGAAGNMVSTADDLGVAVKALATGALLKDKGKKELLAWTKADQDGFEYGFHIEKVDGMIGHDGDVPGYQTAMYYLPEHDASVVALGNLYGWSVRGMPTNGVLKAAVAHCFPQRGKR